MKFFRFTFLVLVSMLVILSPQDSASKDKKEKKDKKETKASIPEKKPFTFEDAMKFKTIKNTTISADGRFVGYVEMPDRGDGTLRLRSTEDSTLYTIERGSTPRISKNSSWAAFLELPKAIDVENAKTPKDKPKNNFYIMDLKSGKKIKRSVATKYEFSNNSLWLAYLGEADKSDDKKMKDKQSGSLLSLRHLESGTEIRIDDVVEFAFDSSANYIFYSVSSKSGEGDGLYVRELNKAFAPESIIKQSDKSLACNITFSPNANLLAFAFSDLEDSGKPKEFSIYLWSPSNNNVVETIISKTNLPKDYYIPQKNDFKWTSDGERLYFGLKHINEKYVEGVEKTKYSDSTFFNLDTIASRADLHLWHWNDPLIMSNQRTTWNKEKDKFYYSVFNVVDKKLLHLGTPDLSEVVFANNKNFTLAYADEPYLKERTWYGDVFDLYSVNLQNGERRLVEKRLEEPANVSPDGKFIVYYKDKHWFCYNNLTRETENVTKELDNRFDNEDFDMPMSTPSYGFGAWLEEGKYFLIHDKYDVWIVVTDDFSILNATAGDGRANRLSLRLRLLDKNKEWYSLKDSLLLQGYNEYTKTMGLYTVTFKVLGAFHLLSADKKFNVMGKAEFADKYVFTQESFEEFPDLWVSDHYFKNAKKISNANPQISDYEWGSTQIVRWKNSRGDSLDGFIIKPYGYDPQKRYPVYVYYYERMSDRTYNFQTPMITHRPVVQVYNSSGYVMFIPDIKYYIGNPGFDALNAITSGAKKLIELGVADSNKFCIQGHSWSGYQTAFIVTQTDFFKAACGGAPVGNMTSAYGQIRLESGLTRQFQYEAQQSRIGGTLWDSLGNYIRNSPVFSANKAVTPLLIMSGDIDEAVPWHQSVELYMAYRRLGKPLIFLQYENEPHWPGRYQNKYDYANKMKEFFDVYMLGKEQPDWMKNGRPYKGK